MFDTFIWIAAEFLLRIYFLLWIDKVKISCRIFAPALQHLDTMVGPRLKRRGGCIRKYLPCRAPVLEFLCLMLSWQDILQDIFRAVNLSGHPNPILCFFTNGLDCRDRTRKTWLAFQGKKRQFIPICSWSHRIYGCAKWPNALTLDAGDSWVFSGSPILC